MKIVSDYSGQFVIYEAQSEKKHYRIIEVLRIIQFQRTLHIYSTKRLQQKHYTIYLG